MLDFKLNLMERPGISGGSTSIPSTRFVDLCLTATRGCNELPFTVVFSIFGSQDLACFVHSTVINGHLLINAKQEFVH